MFRPALRLCWPFLIAGQIACAQETAPASSGDDMHAIRQLIEQQSRQIEALTQQVAKLTQAIGGASTPSETLPAPESKPPATVEAPRAEAVGGGFSHVVAKGETLTSIAKHYKTSIGDLLKVNKIEDERKLQIGQTLIIPKNSEPAPTQKEN